MESDDVFHERSEKPSRHLAAHHASSDSESAGARNARGSNPSRGRAPAERPRERERMKRSRPPQMGKLLSGVHDWRRPASQALCV